MRGANGVRLLVLQLLVVVAVLPLLAVAGPAPPRKGFVLTRAKGVTVALHDPVAEGNGRFKSFGDGSAGQLGLENGNASLGGGAGEMGDALPDLVLHKDWEVYEGPSNRSWKAYGTGSVAATHQCLLVRNVSATTQSERATRELLCYGSNSKGELGYDDMAARGIVAGDMSDLKPVRFGGTSSTQGLANITQVVRGDRFTCALWAANITCWGKNDAGQLGQDNTNNIGDQSGEMAVLQPIAFNGANLANPSQICAGKSFACALFSGGNVSCWGSNADGQLGRDNTVDMGTSSIDTVSNLVPIVLNGPATQISCGAQHACAILSGGILKCWGSNQYGQLGQGDSDDRGDNPAEMPNLLPIDLGSGRAAAYVVCAADTNCAVLNTSEIKCFGRGIYGQLGNGAGANVGWMSGQMGDALSALNTGGADETLHAMQDGFCETLIMAGPRQLRCWGQNDKGQLGKGDTNDYGSNPSETPAFLAPVNLGAQASPPSEAPTPAPTTPWQSLATTSPVQNVTANATSSRQAVVAWSEFGGVLGANMDSYTVAMQTARAGGFLVVNAPVQHPCLNGTCRSVVGALQPSTYYSFRVRGRTKMPENINTPWSTSVETQTPADGAVDNSACPRAPKLEIRGSATVDISVDDTLSVLTTVGPPCNLTGLTGQVVVSWNSLSTPATSITKQPDTTRLNVAPYAMDSGTVEFFKVKAVAIATGNFSNSSKVLFLQVSVASNDVIAVVDGADERAVTANAAVNLTATGSSDPDVADATTTQLQFNWTVTRLGISPAVVLTSSSNGYVHPSDTAAGLAIPSGLLMLGYNYSAEVHVQRASDATGNASSSDTVILRTVTETTTEVSLSVPGARQQQPYTTVSYTDRLVIRSSFPEVANAAGRSSTVYEWRLPHAFANRQDDVLLSSSLGKSTLALKPASGHIPPGNVYTFELLASVDVSGTQSTARSKIDILLNAPPAGGWLNLSASNATAFVDEVTMTSVDWSDTDLPLQYMFRYAQVRDGVASTIFIPLSFFSTGNAFTSTLAGESGVGLVLIEGIVRDALRATANASAAMGLVTNGSLDALDTALDSATTLLQDVGNAESAIASAAGVARTLNLDKGARNLSDPDERADRQALRRRVLELTSDALALVDLEDDSVLEKLLSATDEGLDEPGLVDDQTTRLGLNVSRTALNAYKDGGVEFGTDGSESVFRAQANILVQLANNESLSLELAHTVTQLIQQQADLTLRDALSPGEAPLQYQASTLRMEVTELEPLEVSTDETAPLQFLADAAGANFTVPRGALDAVRSSMTGCDGDGVGVSAVSWLRNPYENTGSPNHRTRLLANVSSLSFRSCDLEEIVVQDVDSDPIEMTLHINHKATAVPFVVSNSTWREFAELQVVECPTGKAFDATVSCPEFTGGGRYDITTHIPCEEKGEQFNVTCPSTWWLLSCLFWNDTTQLWSEEGCAPTSWSNNDSSVTCECTHLTDYVSSGEQYTRQAAEVVASAGSLDESSLRKNLAVVIFLASMWLIYLSVLAIFGPSRDLAEDVAQMEELQRLRPLQRANAVASGGATVSASWKGSQNSVKHLSLSRARGAATAPTSSSGEDSGSSNWAGAVWDVYKDKHTVLSLFYSMEGSGNKLAGLRFNYRVTAAFCELLTVLFVAVFLYEEELLHEETRATLESKNGKEVGTALFEIVIESGLSLAVWLAINALMYSGFERICRARASAAMCAESLFVERDKLLKAKIRSMSLPELASFVTRLEALNKLCKSELAMMRHSGDYTDEQLEEYNTRVIGRLRQKRKEARQLERLAYAEASRACDVLLDEEYANDCVPWLWKALAKRQWSTRMDSEVENQKRLDCLSDEQRHELLVDEMLLQELEAQGCDGRIRAALYTRFVHDEAATLGYDSYFSTKLAILTATVLWMLFCTFYVFLFANLMGTGAVQRALLSMVFAFVVDAIILSPFVILLMNVIVPAAVVRVCAEEYEAASSSVETFVGEQVAQHGRVDHTILAAMLSESKQERKEIIRAALSEAVAEGSTGRGGVTEYRFHNLPPRPSSISNPGPVGNDGDEEESGGAGESVNADVALLFSDAFLQKRGPGARPIHSAIVEDGNFRETVVRAIRRMCRPCLAVDGDEDVRDSDLDSDFGDAGITTSSPANTTATAAESKEAPLPNNGLSADVRLAITVEHARHAAAAVVSRRRRSAVPSFGGDGGARLEMRDMASPQGGNIRSQGAPANPIQLEADDENEG